MNTPLIGDHIISEPLQQAQGAEGTAAYDRSVGRERGAAAKGSGGVELVTRTGFVKSAAGEPADVSGFCGGSAFDY